MGFNAWLRTNAEHYLLVASQKKVAARHRRPVPLPKEGLKGQFFLHVFVPVYRLLPWRFRSAVLQRLPGSHRQTWHPRERKPLGPAI
jgi:hypothetical protein